GYRIAASQHNPILVTLDHHKHYATLWSLKFPRYGDVDAGGEWVEVTYIYMQLCPIFDYHVKPALSSGIEY
ncbi:MAG TPA: hypothetical protein VFT30_09760, partial [Nitrospira sp.]|nr:hypothetical protein [Nitrospira sp.]